MSAKDDRIARLEEEVETLTELLADALPKLVERLQLINQVAYLRAQLAHGNPPTNTLTPGDL
jgi:hypothetical protein